MIAPLIITYVSGFISAENLPTNICILFNARLASSNCSFSSASLLKARITRTPVRFSRVMPSTRSRLACTFLYKGMLISITPNMTIDKSGIATTKIRAAFTSMVKAMIIAPNTINGERKNNRSTRLTPDWIWLMSLVILVIRLVVPSVSISVYESDSICLNKADFNSVENPTAAFAAKYWAVSDDASPTTPRSTSKAPIHNTCGVSCLAIPLSMIDAITSGTNNSKEASNNLNNGPSTDSFL